MSPTEQAALFQRAQETVSAEKLYLDADLTLGALADRVGAPARDLSQAINGAGKLSYFEFINRARIDEAQRRLKEKPAARTIDIAFECGFNSKSAFHSAFKKYAGCTPTQWRDQLTESGR